MIVGSINEPERYNATLTQPLWQEILTWIQTESSQKPDGEYEIRGKDIYVSLTTIQTLPRHQAVFESHRKYIDLHYCIEGGEVIDWTPVDTLTPTMKFDATKDYCLYSPPTHFKSVTLSPGTFAVFSPADAHRPKVTDDKHAMCRKAVVKIHIKLL